MNKTKYLSSKILLFIGAVSYVITFIIGGIFGDALKTIGFITIVMGIIALNRELKEKKREKTGTTILSGFPPKTNFQNCLTIPHLISLSDYFISHEKQMSLVDSDCIISLFQQGYIPASETFNNPKKMIDINPSININTPKQWLVSRLWLDLMYFGNISVETPVSLENMLTEYLNNQGPKMDQTLIAIGSLSKKYSINELEKNWSEEIKKITNNEDMESFKTNYVADTLLSAEVRILAWIYKELFNKEFKFKK